MQYSSLKIFVKSFSIVTLCASTLSQAETKRLILLGPTGVGKTTLINAIYNTAIDTTEFDNYRYITQTNRGQSNAIPPRKAQLVQNFSNHVTETLYAEDIAREKQRTNLDADTRSIIGYRFQPNISGWNMDDDLEIIDAPGFNDTEGEEVTRQITANLSKYLTENPDSLHAIGIIFNESDTKRNSAQYPLIFGQLKRLFSAPDIAERIVTLANYSDFDPTAEGPIQELMQRNFTEVTMEQHYPMNLSYLANANADKQQIPARKLHNLQADFSDSQDSLRNLLLEIGQMDKPICTTEFKALIEASNKDAQAILEYTEAALNHQEASKTLADVDTTLQEARQSFRFVEQNLTEQKLHEYKEEVTKTVYIPEEVDEEISVPVEKQIKVGDKKVAGSHGKITRFFKGPVVYEPIYKKITEMKTITRKTQRIREEEQTEEVTKQELKEVENEVSKEEYARVQAGIQTLEQTQNTLYTDLENYEQNMQTLQTQVANNLSTYRNNRYAQNMLKNRADYQALVERSLVELYPELNENAEYKQHIMTRIKQLLG